MLLDSFLAKVADGVDSADGDKLSKLLSIKRDNDEFDVRFEKQHNSIEYVCSKYLESPWDDIVMHHLKAKMHLNAGNYIEAYESQRNLVQSFLRIMAKLSNWCLRLVYVINDDLRVMATKVDSEVPASEGQQKKLEEAANVVSKSFTVCVTDRETNRTSNKYGAYFLTGLLFRIYFKLRQQNLCKNVVRALDKAGMPDLDYFPKSDRVTYRYYRGRLFFLEEDYDKAEEELSLAFKECTDSHYKNKSLILRTLLPLKLMRGVLPSEHLLAKFPQFKAVYSDLTKAMRRGNIKAYSEALMQSELILVNHGTYFAVERARSIAERQLFRRVYLAMNCDSRIPIQTFQKALDFLGLEKDHEKAEWKLAIMIYNGYIKGYISHEKSMAVLSKENAFPPISLVHKNEQRKSN